MSLKAILWALEDAPVDDPSELICLIALADRASDDGTDAYPSRAWIAHRARISVRTVTRRLKDMESRGVIVRGDQSLLERRGLDPDRRPVVWNLNLQLKRGDNLSPGDSGGKTGCQPGYSGVTAGVTRGDTVGTQTVLNHPEPSLTDSKRNAYSEEFNLWWKTFTKAPGRTVIKSKAWDEYKRVLKKTDDQHLLDQLNAYLPNVKDVNFIKNPDLWLKDGFWEAEYPVVVNPVDEAIAKRDVELVFSLTGVRFREPEGLVELSPAERHAAKSAAFDVWASDSRDVLIEGWKAANDPGW